jgi:hypothetical protein
MFRVGLGTVQGSRLPDAQSITPHDLDLFYVKIIISKHRTKVKIFQPQYKKMLNLNCPWTEMI